jgi:hypothetical protein
MPKTDMKTTHFQSFEGSLWDNRTNTVLRPVYSKQFSRIRNGAQLRATLRAGEFAWPGGYPLYFITSDGEALSFDSVRENLRSVLDSIRTKCDDGWRVVACEVNWEDGELTCSHSGQRIESAYAD